jgi:hypothetical protein
MFPLRDWQVENSFEQCRHLVSKDVSEGFSSLEFSSDTGRSTTMTGGLGVLLGCMPANRWHDMWPPRALLEGKFLVQTLHQCLWAPLDLISESM